MKIDRNQLTEIKKGETGTGLLIENEGFISINDKNNETIKEAIEKGGDGFHVPYPFKLKAVFQKYGIVNANGRIYPEEVLRREVDKYQLKIKERRSYGECNHPEQATIDLGRISFLITELHWEEHTLVGEIEIPTTKGFREYGIVSTLADLVAQWILSGIKIGVSSRGVGTVSNSMGRQIVDDNYEIECWDIVSDPSTPGAWIVPDGNTEMYVEKDNTKDNKPIISEKIEKAAKLFNIF